MLAISRCNCRRSVVRSIWGLLLLLTVWLVGGTDILEAAHSTEILRPPNSIPSSSSLARIVVSWFWYRQKAHPMDLPVFWSLWTLRGYLLWWVVGLTRRFRELLWRRRDGTRLPRRCHREGFQLRVVRFASVFSHSINGLLTSKKYNFW